MPRGRPPGRKTPGASGADRDGLVDRDRFAERHGAVEGGGVGVHMRPCGGEEDLDDDREVEEREVLDPERDPLLDFVERESLDELL